MSAGVFPPPTIGGDRWAEVVHFVVADPADEVTSLVAKLTEATGQHVALVLPGESDEFDSPIAMRLLARAAQRESIDLAIVSERRPARYWADVEGLPTFAKVAHVPRVVRPPEADRPNPARALVHDFVATLDQSASWFVAVGIVLGIVALALLLIPRAEVHLTPVADSLRSTVQIEANVNAAAPDPAKGVIPGRTVYLQVHASGSLPIKRPDHPLDGRAVGSVTFENRTSDPVPVPAGTVVSTLAGTSFETTQPVVLAGRPGATATVPIRALVPGEGSNVRRGEIVVVGGGLHWRVTLVNEDRIAGGGPPGHPIVTTQDVQKLMADVTARVEADGRRRLVEQAVADELVVPESIEVTPIEESFSHQVGEAAPDLAVDAQFRVGGMIVNQDDLSRTAIQRWHPTIRSGFELRPESVRVGAPTVVQVTPTATTFSVAIDGLATKTINADRVAEYVRLRPPAVAAADLSRSFDLAAPPTIRITPNWLGRAYRVEVVVVAAQPPPAE